MVYYMMMIILGVNTDTFYIFHHIDPPTYTRHERDADLMVIRYCSPACALLYFSLLDRYSLSTCKLVE